MSAAPGLGNANLRLVDHTAPGEPEPATVIVTVAPEDKGDTPQIDEKNNILRISHGDGSLTVSLDGKGLGKDPATNDGPKEWFSNLVDSIDPAEVSRITEDLLRGVEYDVQSRKEWIEDRALGIKLLGLKIEIPNQTGSSEGAPVEGMSKVRHPLLLEAVLRFQANARSELLPTDGPVKIRNDDNDAGLKEDQDANAYQRDMNHYLTAVATEYYPDTDRMLLMLGFGGTTFKKVYFCPIRNRPVSEAVDAEDIIVNQAAINLANARRITHRTYLRKSMVKRMQILGVYRDIELSDPTPTQLDALQQEKKDQQGITVNNFMPDDRDREVYEICCELDIRGLEHKHKGKETGLEIPYKVTIDKSSRQCLAITRNYNEDDQELPAARVNYVKYTFVPGFGFYDIGLLHIMGNTTNAVTAAWREMLDNGMYANFPGFLMAKSGTRQNTNIFRIPPGGGQQIDTQGMPIGQAVMPLPYNTAGQPALMDLVNNMVETGQRVGGTSELQVGEGRDEAPVGTTLALIDQAVKIMNSVHKRMCTSQAEEFQLIVNCFKENPQAFWKRGCKSKTPWDEARFMAAANNCELVPQADPNTASMGQRMMKIMGLKQLQQATQQLYDPVACDTAALMAMGWGNPEQFFVPKQARAQPPPQLQELQKKMENDEKAADAKTAEANARLAEASAKLQETKEKLRVGHFTPKQEGLGAAVAQEPPESQMEIAKAMATVKDANTREREVSLRERESHIENQNRDQDREARERDALIGLAKEFVEQPQTVSGPNGGQTHKPAPQKSSAGKKAVHVLGQIDKGLKSE